MRRPFRLVALAALSTVKVTEGCSWPPPLQPPCAQALARSAGQTAGQPSGGATTGSADASEAAARGFAAQSAATPLRQEVASSYAALVEAEYRASLASAESMRAAIRAFCAAPTEAGLARSREAWIAARDIYGRTEVFRFGNGPIDTRHGGVETQLNAWPVDELYIESASASGEAAEGTGIIDNPTRYPSLGRAILSLLNQRGGETNVCTGWHAIEFMLWGQDRSDDGPGDRSFRDFVDGGQPFAERRREYLLEITDLLCEQLALLVEAWKDGAPNHRQRFVADPDRALRAVITGAALLTGFEMAGERLAVAYETRDQEEEHSCFSDTTDRDFRANIRGVDLVLRGRGGPGLLAVLREADPDRAAALERALSAAVAAVEGIPTPFDRAIRAPDDSPERAALKRALVALESLGEELGRAGAALGWSLPTEPQG
jgi:putative iron-regulated protein